LLSQLKRFTAGWFCWNQSWITYWWGLFKNATIYRDNSLTESSLLQLTIRSILTVGISASKTEHQHTFSGQWNSEFLNKQMLLGCFRKASVGIIILFGKQFQWRGICNMFSNFQSLVAEPLKWLQ
jgi:hypothetical protein